MYLGIIDELFAMMFLLIMHSFSVACFLSMNFASFWVTLILQVELSVDRFFYCFWPRICMTDTHIFNRKLLLQWIVFIIWSLVLLTICWIRGKEDLVGSQEKLFNNKGIEEDLKLLRSHNTEYFEKWSKGIWIWGDLGNSSAMLFYSVEIRVCQDKNPS